MLKEFQRKPPYKDDFLRDTIEVIELNRDNFDDVVDFIQTAYTNGIIDIETIVVNTTQSDIIFKFGEGVTTESVSIGDYLCVAMTCGGRYLAKMKRERIELRFIPKEVI